MKRLAFALTLLATPIQAQTIVDGSGSDMDETTRTWVMAIVSQELKDPSSAQFRKLYKNGRTAICGEVNAKNSFGGYAGFEKFKIHKSMEGNFVVTMPSQFPNTRNSPEVQALFTDAGC